MLLFSSISESRYAKLLICVEGSDKSKALAHGCKAYLIYDALHKKLLSEIIDSVTRTANQRRGSSSVTLTDPLIQLKNDEATQLRNYLQTMAIKASSYETHSLFVLLTRQAG